MQKMEKHLMLGCMEKHRVLDVGNPPCLHISKVGIEAVPLDPREMLAIESIEIGVSGTNGLDEAHGSLVVPKLDKGG